MNEISDETKSIVSDESDCEQKKQVILKRRAKEKRKYDRRMADPERRSKLSEKSKRKYIRLKSNPKRYKEHRDKINIQRRSEAGKLMRRKYKQVHYFKYKAENLRGKCKGGHQITPQELWSISIAKKQKLICPLSGRKLTRENISVDHITPLTGGGGNFPKNLRFVDFHANIAKLDYTDSELLQLAKDIVATLGGTTPTG